MRNGWMKNSGMLIKSKDWQKYWQKFCEAITIYFYTVINKIKDPQIW
jgi:hypothetical protein